MIERVDAALGHGEIEPSNDDGLGLLSDVAPRHPTDVLVESAWARDAAGDEGAPGLAMDALVAWARDPGTVDEEEMAALVACVGDASARPLLDVILNAGGLGSSARR